MFSNIQYTVKIFNTITNLIQQKFLYITLSLCVRYLALSSRKRGGSAVFRGRRPRSKFDYRSMRDISHATSGDPRAMDRRLTRVMLVHLLPNPCAFGPVFAERVCTRVYTRPRVRAHAYIRTDIAKDLVSGKSNYFGTEYL